MFKVQLQMSCYDCGKKEFEWIPVRLVNYENKDCLLIIEGSQSPQVLLSENWKAFKFDGEEESHLVCSECAEKTGV